MLIKHTDSHLDHGLTHEQVEYLLARFASKDAFFIETIDLPPELGTVLCGLHGPVMGDPPVDFADVHYAKRGERAWESRLVDRPARPTRQVTVIAGPHKGSCLACGGTDSTTCGPNGLSCLQCEGTGVMEWSCVLYTAFGGPFTPQEPDDPGCKDRNTSAVFWLQHALSSQ